MIDRYRPVIPGYIPIELVVILEKSRAVANQVNKLDSLGGIARAGDINLIDDSYFSFEPAPSVTLLMSRKSS